MPDAVTQDPTLRDLIERLAEHADAMPWALALAVVAPPLLVVGLRLLHGPTGGGDNPWRYAHAVLAFWASLPGMLATCVLAYALVFGEGSPLDQPVSVVLAVIGPVLGMVATLGLMSRLVDVGRVPGFGRISGMLTVLAVSFLVVLLLRRLRFWVVSSLWGMLAAGAFFYAVIRWGLWRAFRPPGEPAEPPPGPPDHRGF